MKKKRCCLDGGAEVNGTLRLPNVEVAPAADAGHVLREKHLAEYEGRATRDAYRDMPLTGKVTGFRKADGSIASEEDLTADARRYGKNFSSDGRFCHVYNHSHVCKPTCFKKTRI